MALANNKEIAVLGYLPEEQATAIEEGRAVFDPVIGLNAVGGKSDRQVRDFVQTLGIPAESQVTDTFRPLEGNQAYVRRRYTSGGEIELGIISQYMHEDPVGTLSAKNPSWDSSVNLHLEQPLFRGRGKAVNMAPIVIARANTNQSCYLFEAEVNFVLRDVELAYWNVAGAHRDLEIYEEALERAGQTLESARGSLKLGQGSLLQVSQSEEQYEEFRVEVVQARNRLVRAQYELRQILGLQPEGSEDLVPEDSPTTTPVEIDWQGAVLTARSRPEMLAQRAAIQAARTDLMVRCNGLQPDLSVQMDYAVTGLEEHFDNSYGTLGTFRYNDWAVGLVYERAWGQRAEHAAVRRARLALSRQQAALVQLDHDILHELATAYENLMTAQRTLEGQRRRVKAARDYLDASHELFRQGRLSMFEKLDGEQRFADAELQFSDTLTNYQQAMVAWRHASGTLLDGTVTILDSTRRKRDAPPAAPAEPPPAAPTPAPDRGPGR